MNLAGQIDKLVERGFSEERPETIVPPARSRYLTIRRLP